MSDTESIEDVARAEIAEPVAAAPRVKKPRTDKQIAATAALVARNKQKKADRQAAEGAAQQAAEDAVNLKIVELAAAEPDSDPDSDYELEATPQSRASESESSESDSSSEAPSDDSSSDSLSGDSSSDDGGIPIDSDTDDTDDTDSDDADDDLYESDEKGDEDEAPAYTPKYFTSKVKDGGYMTSLEKANVAEKRKRPLHKGLLSRGW